MAGHSPYVFMDIRSSANKKICKLSAPWSETKDEQESLRHDHCG